jgi:hypothetical protein
MKLAIPDFIERNFWLKFFSVALATLIWLGIHYSIRHELAISQLNINSITVPVEIIAPVGDTRVFKITPSEAVVFAVGDKSALRKGIRLYVDLSKLHSRQSTPLELQVEAPAEINVLAINPQTVTVEQVVR